ncbi:MAG TPA: hypothetical protein VK102_09490 [Sphingobacterium sp.]|nr:hypothetical protein [Sphingobacterium sp.]
MLNTKQIILIVAVLAIMGALIAQPIKGLIDKAQGEAEATATMESTEAHDLLSISEVFKSGINAGLAEKITSLEEEYQNTSSDEQKEAVLLELAESWDDLAKYAPQGYIFEEIAEISPSFQNWYKAGKAYQQAYGNLQDTTLSGELHTKAIHAFTKALEEDEGNLEAKTGLGSAIVSNGENPMEGVTMLLSVVEEEPRNLEANKALGLFSLQSRQFDKAVERFLVATEQEESAESYFYLATAYENIGMNSEAIAAFSKSKKIASDPTLSQFIDRKIGELSKK